MPITQLPIDDIIQMTLQVGENWAVTHAKRLIELVKQISMDVPYNSHVMELATHMHDWGAFPAYIKRMWNMRFVLDKWLNLKSCRV